MDARPISPFWVDQKSDNPFLLGPGGDIPMETSLDRERCIDCRF